MVGTFKIELPDGWRKGKGVICPCECGDGDCRLMDYNNCNAEKCPLEIIEEENELSILDYTISRIESICTQYKYNGSCYIDRETADIIHKLLLWYKESDLIKREDAIKITDNFIYLGNEPFSEAIKRIPEAKPLDII